MTAQHIKINRPRPFIVAFDVTTAQQNFDFEGPFWEHDDLLVFVITDGGDVPTTWCELRRRGTLLATNAYTVAGLFVQGGGPVVGAYGSGTITLNTAVSECMVVVDRFIVDDRDTDFNQTAPLSQNAINSDLDRLTARDQDLLWRIGNCGVGDGQGEAGFARYAATFEMLNQESVSDGQIVGIHPLVAGVTYAPNFLSSFAFDNGGAAATSTHTVTMKDGAGATFGTITITSAGATVSTSGIAGTFPFGGAMRLVWNGAADATLKNWGISFLFSVTS